MSQVPAPSYGVALAQFKALILWTFTGRFAGRLCIRNPKSKGIVWIWPQGMKFVELAISLYGVSKRGVKTVLQNGYQNGTKNTMFIYELHRGKSTCSTQSDGGGWWTDDFPGINWVMKMVPVVTSRHKPLWHFECKTLSGTSTAFKPTKNPGKILPTLSKTCPPQKSSQSLSKCSKSWTLDQQASLPKDRMAPVTLMAAWL